MMILKFNFGCNFSFHVISLSISCNILQMQHYCICLAFEPRGRGVKDT
jgi:hypothetical protein